MKHLMAFLLFTLLTTVSCTKNDLKEVPSIDPLNFKTSIVVDNSPREVFNAINNVRGWWSEEIDGDTDKLGAEFDYHYENVHRCRMEIVELVPEQRVVWLVKENKFNFTKDPTEWTGNRIVFDIKHIGNKTQLEFCQVGLVPEYECYEICEKAWTKYVQKSLVSLITTGKGQPNGNGKAQTEDEKRLSNH